MTEESRIVTFRRSLSHPDIQVLLLHCEIDVRRAGNPKIGDAPRVTTTILWLSSVDEDGLTYLLKSDQDGSSRLNIIDKINIPDGSLVLEINFAYNHTSK